MSKFCLTLFRLCLAAWFGIAVFFVSVVVGLRNSPLFEAAVKLNHPKVLFPLYYGFEFGLLATALACGLAARAARITRESVSPVALGLLAAALLVAAADYVAIYRPLAEMIARSALPAEFAQYHRWSMWINSANLLVTGAAAGAAVWPLPGPSDRQARPAERNS